MFVQNLRFFFVTPLIFNSLTERQFCLLKSCIETLGGLFISNTLKGDGGPREACLRGRAYLI